jgi:hypothetical protein
MDEAFRRSSGSTKYTHEDRMYSVPRFGHCVFLQNATVMTICCQLHNEKLCTAHRILLIRLCQGGSDESVDEGQLT